MNERLRLYNQKLQDRLAKTIEHKVQAESTLASVKIANEEAIADKENETEVDGEPVQDGDQVSKEEKKVQKNEEENGFIVVPEKGVEGNGKEKENNTKSINNKENTEKNKKNSEKAKTEVNVTEKQEVNKKDPNRPRYTLAEMQQVLEERNRYKERVSVLEDVLEAYTPG